MKSIIRLFILMFFVFFTSTIVGQACEIKTETETETSVEDGDNITSELGDEVGEMGLEEADMLGTEAIESGVEVGAEVAAEISVEVAAETAAFVFSEALPVVGFAVGVGVLIYTIVNESKARAEHRKYIKAKRQKEKEYMMHAGSYSMPDFPTYHISAEDLNGARDTVSYQIFLEKEITSAHLRQYLLQHGISFPSNPESNMKAGGVKEKMMFDVFSMFGYEGLDDENSMYPYAHDYRFTVPTFTLSKVESNGVESIGYSYTANWSHSVSGWLHDSEDGWPLFWLLFDTEYSRSATNKVAKFYLTSQNNDGSFNNLTEIPVNVDDLNSDELGLRIHDFDISSYRDQGPLFVSMQVKFLKKYIEDSNSNNLFPENFDPKSSGANVFAAYDQYDTRPDPITDLSRKYYPNTKNSHPNFYNDYLFHFKIHDYQPRDTEATILQKSNNGVIGETNPFPILRSDLLSRESLTLELGKSNIRIDIPSSYNHNQKRITYIELEDITSGENILLEPELVGGESVLNTRFITLDSRSDNLPSSIRRSIEADVEDNIDDISSVENPVNDILDEFKHEDTDLLETLFLNTSSTSSNLSIEYDKWVVSNVPFNTGNLIEITTHYEDGSFSRNTVAMPETNTGFLRRGYYNISLLDGDSERFLKEDTYVDITSGGASSSNSKWLIDYLGNNLYTIMNKNSKKVLGVNKGQVKMMNFRLDDPDIIWYLQFNDNDDFKLVNLGSESYLNITSEFEPVSNIFSGVELSAVRVEDAPDIFDSGTTNIANRNSSKVLSYGNGEQVIFEQKLNAEAYADVAYNLYYVGALNYVMYSKSIDKYLNLYYELGDEFSVTEPELVWDTELAIPLRFDSVDDEYFNLTYGNNALKKTGDELIFDDELTSSWETDNDYQFSFSNPYDLPLAHYAFDGNANDSSGNNHHGTSYGDVVYYQDSNNDRIYIKLDGDDDYVDTNFDFRPDNYDGNFSVTFWMKHDSSNSDDWGGVIQGSTFDILLEDDLYQLNRKIWMLYEPSTRSSRTYNPINFLSNGWDHIALTIESTGEIGEQKVSKMYRNGELQDESDIFFDYFSEETFTTYIGKWLYGDSEASFAGGIDDVKFWGKTLSPDEILDQIDYPVSTSNRSSIRKETVSVDSTIVADEMLLWPNPSGGHFSLKFSVDRASEVYYQIMSLTGEVLQTEARNLKREGDHIWQINASKLSKGVYFINVVANGQLEKNKKMLIE